MDSTSNETNISLMLNAYRETVYKLAVAYMKNKYDADDVYQNVFLRYIKYKPDFASDDHAKAWFIRTTINCCKSMHTSSWFSKTVVTDRIDTGSCTDFFDDNVLLKKVLALPKKYSTVLHLYYYEEYNASEIATILECSVSTVTTKLNRGRNLLKKELEKEGGLRVYGL